MLHGEGGSQPHRCRFVFLLTFISGLVYFSLKCGCYAKSCTRISRECVISQLLPGCFCDLGNNKGIETNSGRGSSARKALSPKSQFRGGTSPIPSWSPSLPHQLSSGPGDWGVAVPGIPKPQTWTWCLDSLPLPAALGKQAQPQRHSLHPHNQNPTFSPSTKANKVPA